MDQEGIERSINILQDDLKIMGKEIQELKLQSARIQSHIDSELGNIGRILKDIDDKTTKVGLSLWGNGTADNSLIIRLDRLEQDRKKQSRWNAAYISGFVILLGNIIFTIIKEFFLAK